MAAGQTPCQFFWNDLLRMIKVLLLARRQPAAVVDQPETRSRH
jgi:hypothetical protein